MASLGIGGGGTSGNLLLGVRLGLGAPDGGIVGGGTMCGVLVLYVCTEEVVHDDVCWLQPLCVSPCSPVPLYQA